MSRALSQSNAHTGGQSSSTEERAIELLGSGLPVNIVANALGVTDSRISQLLSDEEFSKKVAEKRFLALQKHNTRDLSYDEIEDQLLSKLQDLIPLMLKPMEIIRAIATINGAKRRGASNPESTINQQNIVNLVLPTTIINKFVTNVNNQVVRVGEQDLVTVQPQSLMKRVTGEEGRVIEHSDSDSDGLGNHENTANEINGQNLSSGLAELKARLAGKTPGT